MMPLELSWFVDTMSVFLRHVRVLRSDPTLHSMRSPLLRSCLLRMMTVCRSLPKNHLRLRACVRSCDCFFSYVRLRLWPQPPPQKVCDFEGLFGTSVSKPESNDVPTMLFHCVAELLVDHRRKFQANLEASKLPASGLPSRRRGPGACEEPTLRSAAPINSSLFCLVGILSSRRSISFSFDEAAKVKLLVKGQLDAHSMSFWLCSTFLHWLKELGFVPLDPALFEQLVQALSLSLVGLASSSAALTTYFQAKRRQGVLSRFSAHVGLHFRRDLASFSFARPDLFDEEVLARVIAVSREDTHLDTQLSLAKVFSFTLPVFCGARNSDRKASSGQSSAAVSSPVSTPRGRGRGSTEFRSGKRKASSSPGKGRFTKSPH